MSNEKEIIKKLIKIANNQQKIINKLAQALPPQPLEPVKPELHPGQIVLAALPALIKSLVEKIDAVGAELRTTLKPGATQATVSSIQNIADNLTKQNKLPFPMTVKPV